jgi:anti-sigma28 factor (negative regulator of flagellin synthesis)
MVTQINDKNLTGLLPLQSAANPNARPVAPEPEVQSAAKIGLSEASSQLKAQTKAMSAQTEEVDLVREIKARVNAGTFQIDYDMIGQNMLKDLIARAGGSRP